MAKGKRRRQKINGWRLLFVGVLLVLAITVVLVVKNIIALQIEKRELEKQEEELQAKKEELTQELQNVDDLEYIEEQARKLLRMIKPGEVLYVLNGTDPRPEQGESTEEVIIPEPLEKPSEETSETGEGYVYENDGSYTTDETYTEETYGGDVYYDETYTDETYTDETYTDESYTGEGYYDETYTEETYTDDGYYEEGYTDGTYTEEGYTENWEG